MQILYIGKEIKWTKTRKDESMVIESFAKYLIQNAKEYGTSDIHVLPEIGRAHV